MVGLTSPDQHRFVRHPHRTIAAMTAPMMASLVVEPLAGVVDTAFVERVGAAPAAALGAATALLSGVLWVFNFLGIGTQTEVARGRGLGAEDTSDLAARESVTIALTLAVLLGVGLAALGWPWVDSAAAFMSDEPAVLADTIRYLEIRLLGIPAVLVTIAAFGALRGDSDMVTPMWVAGALTVLNVGMDAVLVFGAGPFPRLEIAGAAWATTISQMFGAALATAAALRRFPLARQVQWSRSRALFRVGRDMTVRTAALLGFLLIATRAALAGGVESGAAHQALRQIWTLLAYLLDAFAATAQTLVAFFLGANRADLARRVAGVTCLWGLITGVLVTGLLLVLEYPVALLLVPAGARDLFAGAWFVCAVAQPLNAVAFVTDGIHWGTGDFPYLRNGMVVATGVGLALLWQLDPADPDLLRQVWWVTALWIALRSAFGVARIWPARASIPLAVSRPRPPP